MEISKVTEKDALMAANLGQILTVSTRLLDALKLAGLPVSGPGLDRRDEVSRWLHELLVQMADNYKASKAVPSSSLIPRPKKSKETISSTKSTKGKGKGKS